MLALQRELVQSQPRASTQSESAQRAQTQPSASTAARAERSLRLQAAREHSGRSLNLVLALQRVSTVGADST